MNKVMIQNTVLEAKDILSGTNITSHAMVGETLAVDQLICVVNTEDQPFVPADQEGPLITNDHKVFFSKNDIDVSAFRDGDEVLYYNGETLAGKYFFESVVQQGMNRYKITAVSIIGRLLSSRHFGGIYTGQQAATIFADILAGATYYLDPVVAAATVTGYLPIATRRDNLQQLLAATGSTVRIDEAGQIYITVMSPVQAGEFAAPRVYIGGSVSTEKPVAGVRVTEHNYFPAGNVVTLYADGVDGEELIEFGEPYHDLAIKGGTIVASGANFARIQAKGTVTLTGQPYTHVTRVVTAGEVTGAATENVKSVPSCYLANPQIAQALADRFYEFLKCNRTITQDVLTGTERAGDVVAILNPYTMEMETATIKRMDVTMSGINKASADFLVGFVPQGSLSGFTNFVRLNGSGTWTVPAGVTKIRIIVIGGGSGGGGGTSGSSGGSGSWSGSTGTAGKGGSGGKAGKAGEGGRVFELSLDVTPGELFSYRCGAGGSGGSAGGGSGTAGSASVFGGYSSEFGRFYPYGYYEAKTGLTMAASGAAGYDGGDGGDARSDFETRGENGESVAGYSGGLGGIAWSYDIDADGRNYWMYSGQGGGGAAYGAMGGSATTGKNSTRSAGAGANASAGAAAFNPGQGGGGGSGGGGGGGGGLSAHINASFDSESYYGLEGAAGGAGSRGGSGAAGTIIVYY